MFAIVSITIPAQHELKATSWSVDTEWLLIYIDRHTDPIFRSTVMATTVKEPKSAIPVKRKLWPMAARAPN